MVSFLIYLNSYCIFKAQDGGVDFSFAHEVRKSRVQKFTLPLGF